MSTKHSRTPGRPRQFDPEQAIETAQHLFHSRGYDAVSVADLTKAFGINPPSFLCGVWQQAGAVYSRIKALQDDRRDSARGASASRSPDREVPYRCADGSGKTLRCRS